MIALVTGVPGVGKTSLCRELALSHPDTYTHLAFGKLILHALGRPELPEADLRRKVSELVTAKVLRNATDHLFEVVESFPADRTLLVDSHAVSQDSYGYVVTPDGPDYFQRVRYAAIIQLYAREAEVLRRSDASATGRQARSEEDVQSHFYLQSAVSVAYASHSQCPLYVIDSNGNLRDVANRVNALLQGVRE